MAGRDLLLLLLCERRRVFRLLDTCIWTTIGACTFDWRALYRQQESENGLLLFLRIFATTSCVKKRMLSVFVP
jgi:hypothetical protein